MNDLSPEISEAIRIADKHLPEASSLERKALAMDIAEAVVRHAGVIANDAIRKAFDKTKAAMAN